jgi:hypothetical protein
MADREAVQLGGQVVELDPKDAATVRSAFMELSHAYGASLDEQRRQLLGQMGTPQWQAPPPQAFAPAGVDVPDVELLFQDKQRWADHLATSIEARLAHQQMQSAALVQGAVSAVDQEFKRRELRDRAQEIHDTTMEEMIARRGLDDHRTMIQAIYNDRYQALQHLPLAMAIDQIGEETGAEIARIRGEAPGSGGVPVQALEPAAPAPPPTFLRSARRASGGGGVPAAAPKTLTDLIRARQAHALGTAA